MKHGTGKKVFFVLLFFLSGLLAGQASGASLKIGYVDLQKVINESEAGKAAREEFSQEIKKRQAEVNRRQKEIKDLQEEYSKKATVLKEEARRKKQQEIAEKSRGLQEFIARSERELRQKESKLTKEIIGDIRAIVVEYAKEKGYTYIFEKREGGILYGPEGDDLTQEIIKRYNKKYRALKGGKK